MEDKLVLLFTGDLCPVGRVEKACTGGHAELVFQPVKHLLADKDISVTNLECVLSEKGEKIRKAGPVLSAGESCSVLLEQGSFDIVSLANNHIMDRGPEGLFNTMKIIKGLKKEVIGAGKNLETASDPLFIEKNGLRVAFIAAADEEFSIAGQNSPGAAPFRTIDLYYSITEARKQADFVIVIIHSGHEGYPLPSPEHVKKYRFLANAGASAIISHHSHKASGYERYNHSVIFYGLGNFVFDSPGADPSWNKGYLVKLVLEKGKNPGFEIIPFHQCLTTASVHPMEGNEKSEFLKTIDTYCNIISDKDRLQAEWDAFTEKRLVSYYSKIYQSGPVLRYLLRKKMIGKSFWKKKKFFQLLNSIRSEVHREALIDALKQSQKSKP